MVTCSNSTRGSEFFKLRSLILTAGIFILILAVTTTIKSYADDKCAKISDSDDRLKCYNEQIEKKEDEYESTSKKLEGLRNQKNTISNTIATLSSQLNVTQSQITSLENSISETQKEVDTINYNLNNRKDNLAHKIDLKNKVLRNYSKRHVLNGLEMFLYAEQAQESTTSHLSGFEYASFAQVFNENLTEEVVKLIGAINGEIDTFEKDKKEAEELKRDLEEDQKKLLALKNDLANKKNQTQGELNNINSQESSFEGKLANLQKEIESLSAKQKEILSKKYGDSGGTVGDYESPGSSTPSPPFKPAFAAFSYGAYTHYNGMSQYGALGRAKDNKKYDEILKFYYKVGLDKKGDSWDKDTKIKVKLSNGSVKEMSYRDYLYGIAEMPSDWHVEALKAQAVAARTYAYRSSKPICTTESCQVYNQSKADKVKSGQYPKWKEAVDKTSGQILNNPKTSQYSSTTGGYINNVGWDTKSGGKWPGDAYEKKSGSPWFYKAWYTKNYGSDNCGRAHPWLSEKEMADILNAWVVWKSGTESERDHISPVTTSCWGGDPYSLDEMAKKADKYGDKYSKVTSVDVDISSDGYTSKVKLGTDKGTVTMSGDAFKTVFNLRAPGYVSIKSKLFDLEERD